MAAPMAAGEEKSSARSTVALSARTVLRTAPVLLADPEFEQSLAIQTVHLAGLLGVGVAVPGFLERGLIEEHLVHLTQATDSKKGTAWPSPPRSDLANAVIEGTSAMADVLACAVREGGREIAVASERVLHKLSDAMAIVGPLERVVGALAETYRADRNAAMEVLAEEDPEAWKWFFNHPLWTSQGWESLGRDWHERIELWGLAVEQSGWGRMAEYGQIVRGRIDWSQLEHALSNLLGYLGSEPPAAAAEFEDDSLGLSDEDYDAVVEPPPAAPLEDAAPSEPLDLVEPAEKKPEPRATPRARRVVNTGFAEPEAPTRGQKPDQPLRVDSRYLFWFEIGLPRKKSIEKAPKDVPRELLPADAEIAVALFGFPGEIEIESGSVGVIRLDPVGPDLVVRQPQGLDGVSQKDPKRLLFAVRTPKESGRYHLRCNIYYRNVLLQSRLVTAYVRKLVRRKKDALRSDLDYTLSGSLDSVHLAALPEHSLSILLNDNGNGKTHQFRFFGGKEVTRDSVLTSNDLETLLLRARRTMRLVSWGTEDEFDEGVDRFRYVNAPSREQFEKDLIRFARVGCRTYDDLIDRLAGGRKKSYKLQEIMASPGVVQIANKRAAGEVIPAALFYDHDLDDQADLTICGQFRKDMGKNEPLEKSPCFRGQCPSRTDVKVVCPSGFWGYRHEIGIPISTVDVDVATDLGCRNGTAFGSAVWIDFKKWKNHFKSLAGILRVPGLQPRQSKKETIEMLKQGGVHIVYFYCHGGLQNDVPYIKVGAEEYGITRVNLRTARVYWEEPEPRPLVFINGCHTAALSPSRAFSLVTGFVNGAGAAGVIGTEITIYEELACSFAEAFLDRFIGRDESLGAALRGARLELLKQRNPLGLVYIPFAQAGLSLRPKP